MRNRIILCFLLCILLITSSVCAVYADSSERREAVSTSSSIYWIDSGTLDSILSRSASPIASGTIEGELIDVKQTRETVTPSDANGLKAIMLTLIGDYETVTTDYTYQSSNGYYSHSITTERDWSWIMSCALFVVVIWCVFRGVVAILCRR